MARTPAPGAAGGAPLTPVAARVYIWAVALAATGGLAGWLRAGPAPAGPGGLALAGGLVALGVAAQHLPLPLGPRRKFDLAPGVYFAALLLLGAPLAIALAGAAHLLGQGTLALRRDPATGRRRATARSALFNAAQLMLATAAGGAVLAAGLPPPAPAPLERPASLWAVPAAAAAMHLANRLAVAGVVALQLGQPLGRAWRAGRGAGLPPAAAPYLVGVAVALLAPRPPWGPAVVVLLLAAAHLALRQALDLLDRERAARAAAEAARADADRARAAAEAAVRARGEFMLVAAHELRTPLTSLRGYAELLLAQLGGPGGPARGAPGAADPARTRRALAVIDRESEKLARLATQLLDAARLQEGRLRLDRRPTDVAALAAEAVARAQDRTERPLRLDAPGPAWAAADALRLEQVLVNLLDNAVRHTLGKRPVEVTVRRRPGAAGAAATVAVAVRDHGLGVPPALRERIFEPYDQGDAAAGSRAGGAGLGLHISREIVAAHAGTLTVETPPDGGARFVVTLPATAPPAPAAAG